MSQITQHFLLLGVLTFSAALVFFWSDRNSPTSRALALCLLLIGVRLLIDPLAEFGWVWWVKAVGGIIEAVAILAGIDWARRVGLTAAERLRRSVNAMFRAAQVLVLVYGFLQLGYLLIAPDAAVESRGGLIDVRGYEWAIFAPVLGTAALLAGIAILVLLVTRADPAESIRLRALVFAAPFLFAGLVVGKAWVPLVLVIGLMIFMAGTVRYLIVQAQRAQALSQFLSPEVARLVKLRGLEEVLRRDRRRISVVICDLRRFTAFAAARDSAAVVDLLERYYNVVGAVAFRHGGTIKDHAGDGVVVLVGAPVAYDDHPQRAARLALELVTEVRALLAAVDPGLGVGVGVASGEVAVGAIHGSGRLEYVAVGTPVNLAARLCERAGNGEVLIDDAIRTGLGSAFAGSERGAEILKGFDRAVAVYALHRG